MAKRRKEKKIYKYECSITGDTYKVTEKSESPDDLISVQAWYEMNTDKDDRPEVVKKRIGMTEEIKKQSEITEEK
mgnify:CR=1 FL=1